MPWPRQSVSQTIRCPFCGHHKTYVLQSKNWAKDKDELYRRRICYECSNAHPEDKWAGRFSTWERILIRGKLMVQKRNGKREPFSRDKIKASIRKAFVKREVSEERLDRLVTGIAITLDKRNDATAIRPLPEQYLVIPSERVGALVLSSLKELDQVAYVRYASVFLNLTTTEQYDQLLDSLK